METQTAGILTQLANNLSTICYININAYVYSITYLRVYFCLFMHLYGTASSMKVYFQKLMFVISIMVEVLDCRIVVSEFELQLRYYIHFRTNTLGKGMNPSSS